MPVREVTRLFPGVRLARYLFEEIWVQDKKVVAVKPRGEFEPFFRLNLEADRSVKENIELATPTGFETPRNP